MSRSVSSSTPIQASYPDLFGSGYAGLGKFKEKRARCNVAKCSYQGDRRYTIYEEKGTDVNIALAMLDDAQRLACDRMILVSGDSDLVPAVRIVRSRFPVVEVVVYVPATHPQRAYATELRGAAHKHGNLPLQLLPNCQFSNPVLLPSGEAVYRPAEWGPLDHAGRAL